MLVILVDHNIEGYALLLWGTLSAAGWPALLPLRLVTFVQVGLPYTSSDLEVWRFAQSNGMLLLTANRRMEEEDSLEQTIRRENISTSLPVVTIGDANRMVEKAYRERCAVRLLEIVLEIDNYLGTGRLFIP
jgi:hypothetical protein